MNFSLKPSLRLKARSDYRDSAATSDLCIALRLIGNFSIFTATNCISHSLQKNCCIVNKPLVLVIFTFQLIKFYLLLLFTSSHCTMGGNQLKVEDGVGEEEKII